MLIFGLILGYGEYLLRICFLGYLQSLTFLRRTLFRLVGGQMTPQFGTSGGGDISLCMRNLQLQIFSQSFEDFVSPWIEISGCGIFRRSRLSRCRLPIIFLCLLLTTRLHIVVKFFPNIWDSWASSKVKVFFPRSFSLIIFPLEELIKEKGDFLSQSYFVVLLWCFC